MMDSLKKHDLDSDLEKLQMKIKKLEDKLTSSNKKQKDLLNSSGKVKNDLLTTDRYLDHN